LWRVPFPRTQATLLSAREEARSLLARAAALIPLPPPPPLLDGVLIQPEWVRCTSPPPRRRAGALQPPPPSPEATRAGARSAPASPQAPWSSLPLRASSPERARARASAVMGARRAERAAEARAHADNVLLHRNT
jgi:hypothetical protein